MAETPLRPGGERAVALSQELSEFLIELSIALHRHGMYPQGHPSLLPAALNVIERLDGLVRQHGSLSLGVARRQLVIEGIATDPRHPVLQELAGRLHRHHVGAVRFEAGCQADELSEFLRQLAVEADLTGEPMGLGDPARLEAWPHIRAYPLTYGQLELVDDAEGDSDEGHESGARAARLWLGLARAALAAPADAPVRNEEPTAVAEAINRHERAEAYDQVIVGYMLQIADELKSEGGASAAALRRRISSVIGNLTPETLERLVEMSGDFAQRRKFVADATRVFAVDAVVDVMTAAANASGQTVSHSILRMLSKLAAHADHGSVATRAPADAELREQVRSLVDGWSLPDPNPDRYTRALHAMARAEPARAPAAAGTQNAPEPDRLIVMALEMGAYGPAVADAAERVRQERGVGAVMRMLDSIDEANAGAAGIWKQIAATPVLEEELRRPAVDTAQIRPLVERLGLEAVPALLDTLAEAESSSLRRGVMDLLADLGPDIAPAVAERVVRDERWYVQRNLLSVLAEVRAWPRGLDPGAQLGHPDGRVRREAYRLLLQLPGERERAVCTALADPDPRNLRQGIAAARERMPAAAVGLVAQRLSDDALSSDLRIALIRLLAGNQSPLALDALLKVVTSGKTLFGGVKLAAPAAETIEAVRILARDWPSHPRARAVLDRARRSRDAQLRSAVRQETT
ncbi:MAG TPA: hypothetical protein VMN78_13345 [Longimicrobiales bacterium]|nr:hypothetical protein [Longimicrobiales bacterium]